MELVGWQVWVASFAGLAAWAVVVVWGTFAMIHADEAKGRKRALEGASTEDLKRVERELDEVRRELRKRRTPDA